MPLVSIIFNTGPLFVFILNYFIFSHKISSSNVQNIALAFLGVVIASSYDYLVNNQSEDYRPDQYFDGEAPNEQLPNRQQQSFRQMVISFAFLGSLIVYAYSILLIKRIKSGALVINLNGGIYYTFTSSILLIRNNRNFAFADLL